MVTPLSQLRERFDTLLPDVEAYVSRGAEARGAQMMARRRGKEVKGGKFTRSANAYMLHRKCYNARLHALVRDE